MAEEIEGDFKQIKISRLTLGLIMSVAVTSAESSSGTQPK